MKHVGLFISFLFSYLMCMWEGIERVVSLDKKGVV